MNERDKRRIQDSDFTALEAALRSGDANRVDRERERLDQAVLSQTSEAVAESMRCDRCGATHPADRIERRSGRRFCPEGHEILEATQVVAIDSVREHKANSCPKCGASFRANDIFCGDCGHGLRKASDEDQDWAPESKRRDHCAEPPPTPGHADEVTRVVPLHVESQPTTFRLVVVGAGREAIDLTKDVTVLGSGDVDVVIKTDAYLDRRHCLLSYRKGRLYLVDQESANGTLRRLRRGERCRLRNGMRVCFAGHLMRFERRAPAESTNPTSTELLGGERDVAPACFVEVLMRGRHGDLRFLESGVSSIGRGSDQVLQLNADPAISRAHAHVLLEEDEFFLIDGSADGHASSAGTFVEIDEEVELKVGDAFRAGKREFLIEG